MLVQIYSLANQEDVRACAEAGVDHIGVAAGDQDVPANISIQHARELFAAAKPEMKTSALSVHTEMDGVVDLARAVEPDIIHVCSDTYALDAPELEAIHKRIPDEMELMKAVDVADAKSVDAATAFAPVCDWLLLDTATEDISGVGASGHTHDWSLSREIVESVDVPVILAGGLSPENVADAIRAVRPAGVDSYTHTSQASDRKDPRKVAAFAENARRAATLDADS
jgi:phosphoribosylanthranilate isomerase